MLGAQEIRYLLNTHCRFHGLVRHQLESFNHFVNKTIHDIIKENSSLVIESGDSTHTIEFVASRCRPPSVREADGTYHKVMPNEARTRNMSYQFDVFCDVKHTKKTGDEETVDVYVDLLLASIPCMCGSSVCNITLAPWLPGVHEECPLDIYAYFIVNGNEKVVVSQEKVRTNFALVRWLNAKNLVMEIRSLHHSKVRSTSTISVNLSVGNTTGRKCTCSVSMPFVTAPVHVFQFYKIIGESIGMRTFKDVYDFIDDVTPLDLESRHCVMSYFEAIAGDRTFESQTKAEIIDYVGKLGTKEPTVARRYNYINHIIVNEVLPHEGLDDSDITTVKKLTCFSMSVVKMIQVRLGFRPADDRDDFAHKRVDNAGQLFALLFRQLFRHFLKHTTHTFSKHLDNNRNLKINDIFNSKKISQSFRYAASTGTWGLMKTSSQTGVVQLLSRSHNYLSFVSQMRKTNTSVNRDGQLPKPRELSLTHHGILCAVETPEGSACGLVESLTLLCHARVGTEGYILEAIVEDAIESVTVAGRNSMWKVIINGSVSGYTKDHVSLLGHLRRLRASNGLSYDTTIYLNKADRAVCVDADTGALLLPKMHPSDAANVLALMRQCPPELLWTELVRTHLIRYFDKLEERTHGIPDGFVDITPVNMLGVCASIIPFLNHNQSPRNIYESSMTKQSIGSFSSKCQLRYDPTNHSLVYPQENLVKTHINDCTHSEYFPYGVNCVVAILSITGYNQEDSIIINRGSVERGLFRTLYYKTIKEEEKGFGAEKEFFGEATEGGSANKLNDYGKIEKDGFPKIGEVMETNDIVVGKYLRTSSLGKQRKSKEVFVDHSTLCNVAEPMRVTSVILTTNKENTRTVKVKMKSVRIPEVGDKLSSSHAQKGVIGAICDEVDMPYTDDGIVPDLIINAHAIPSRMTVAQFIESVFCKYSCLSGTQGHGVPFDENVTIDKIKEGLRGLGWAGGGDEVMFDPFTGKEYKTTVFIGPVFYQRLKHFVIDKIHSRSRGAKVLLTRQPTEGRSKNGGSRMGTMEVDTLISHGVTSVIVDRLFEQSDKFDTYVCKKCGFLAENHASTTLRLNVTDGLFCRHCSISGKDNIKMISIPFSMKLLMQELNGLNIAVKIRLQDPP